MSIANELRVLEDKLEDIDNRMHVVHGTTQMIVTALDAGYNTEQASWVAAGVADNTAAMLKEMEQLITATMRIRTNIETLIT